MAIKCELTQGSPEWLLYVNSLPKTHKEALQIGSTVYFTGLPCSRGHADIRFSRGGNCRSCCKRHKKTYRESIREVPSIIRSEKICSECGILRKSRRFYRNKTQSDWLSSRCKYCIAKIEYPSRNYKIRIKRKRIKYLVDSYRDVPCNDCGIKYQSHIMDFDHRPTEQKLFNLSQSSHLPITEEEILREINKCDVVCANCHRQRTWERKSGN